MSWPTGIETIKALLAAENLQKVAPSLDAATASLHAAARHIDSALLLTEHDPDATLPAGIVVFSGSWSWHRCGSSTG
jgi:hypothetical protein